MGQRFKRAPDTAGEAQRGGSGQVPKDEIFELISNHRRRYVIHYCKQAEGPVSLSDLAEQISAWENDKDIAEITSSERKTTYTSLQQTHIPRLKRAGIIQETEDGIELTDHGDRLNIYLDIVPEKSVSWGVYYAGLSVFSLVVIAGLWADLLPTDAIPVLAYPTVLVLFYGVSASYHYWQNHRYRFDNFDRPP